MAEYIVSLKIEKVGGASRTEALTDEPVTEAKMTNFIVFAWDAKATDAEKQAGGPGDDLALDMEMVTRAVRDATLGWYSTHARRAQITEGLQ